MLPTRDKYDNHRLSQRILTTCDRYEISCFDWKHKTKKYCTFTSILAKNQCRALRHPAIIIYITNIVYNWTLIIFERLVWRSSAMKHQITLSLKISFLKCTHSCTVKLLWWFIITSPINKISIIILLRFSVICWFVISISVCFFLYNT